MIKRFCSKTSWIFELLALVLYSLNTANIRYTRTRRLEVHAVRRGLFRRLRVTGHLAVTDE